MIRALKHFEKEHGLVFNSLSPFNEPGSPAWIAPIAVQEGCYFNHGRMNDVRGAGQGRDGAAFYHAWSPHWLGCWAPLVRCFTLHA
jgi:hypothetical protein